MPVPTLERIKPHLDKKKTKALIEIISRQQYNYDSESLNYIKDLLLVRGVPVEYITHADKYYHTSVEQDRKNMHLSNRVWMFRIVMIIIGCMIVGLIRLVHNRMVIFIPNHQNKNMNNIKQSLLIMDYFAWVVIRKAEMLYTKLMYVVLVDDKVYDDDNYHMLSQSCILNACSFMEEYHKEFGVKTGEEFKEKINIVKKIVTPYTRIISKWSDLNGYRNAIPHTLRDKQGRFIYLDPDIENKYNTPNNPYEWLLLRNCMIELKSILNYEFQRELECARKEIETVEYNFKKEPIWTAREMSEKFLSIVDESAAVAKKFGKYYNPNITDFYNKNKPVVKYGMIESY